MRVSDSGSIVLGWLTKLVVLFAVLGFLAYDGISLVQANVSTADEAGMVAQAAAENYRSSKNLQAAYDEAVRSLSHEGDTVEASTFSVDPAGVVTLTVERTPKTLWMKRIGPLRNWTHVRQSGTGAPPS